MSEIYVLFSGEYSDREALAVLSRKEDANALTDVWADTDYESFTLDDPTLLDRLRSGLLVWTVMLTAPDRIDLSWPGRQGDRAHLSAPLTDAEPMRPSLYGFFGYVEARSAEEAIALAWDDVRERNLEPLPAAPPHAPRPAIRKYLDFQKYLEPGEAIDQKTIEWGT